MKELKATNINELETELKELGYEFQDFGEISESEIFFNGTGSIADLEGDNVVAFDYEEIEYEEGFERWYGVTKITNARI
jgi:hypothetical protein